MPRRVFLSPTLPFRISTPDCEAHRADAALIAAALDPLALGRALFGAPLPERLASALGLGPE